MFQGTQTELFAEYNLWMNEKLYAAAAQLSDAQRKRDLRAFFKSLHGTLDHILWGDTAWLARLQGHRGQATTLLMQLGVDPGITDIPMLPALNV